MTASIALDLSVVLGVALGFVATAALATATGAILIRRLWRKAGAPALERAKHRALGAPLPSTRRIGVIRVRAAMWRALSEAERAVGLARSSGVEVSELASLCRRIRSAATGIDRGLRVSGGGQGGSPQDPALRLAAAHMGQAATSIQHAALAAMAAQPVAAVPGLVEDVNRELSAIAAGLARLEERGTRLAPGPDDA